jgi:uncharacterized pyridoxal phosphate-containing UPF0001 family protein
MAALTAAAVAERLGALGERIRQAGGDPAAITVVGVTKTLGPDAVAAAVGAGLHDLGENYPAELAEKAAAAMGTDVRWHFIGGVQRRHVGLIAPVVHLWQGVDRLAEGEAVARRAPGAAVLVQVDVTGEPQKGGCPAHDVPALVDGLRALGLDVQGLMAVGPAGPPDAARPGFRALSVLADRLELPERSMGMSGDLEVAVQEGSTMVRVGTALFGPRSVAGAARR